MSDSAQLRSLAMTKLWLLRPFTPPCTGITDRASGNAVNRLKRSTMGCGG